jgi:hypothetical protein
LALSQAAFSLVLTFLMVALKMKVDWMLFPLSCFSWLFPLCCSRPGIEAFVAKIFCFLNPMGWLNGLFLEGCLRANWQAWWLLVPVLVVFASLPYSLPRLRRLHLDGTFRKVQPRHNSMNIVIGGKEKVICEREPAADQRRRIENGDFLRPLLRDRSGLIERLIARALGPKEKAVLEMLHATSAPRWSRQLGYFLLWFALFMAANTQIHFESLDDIAMAIAVLQKAVLPSVAVLLASGVFFAMMLAQGAYMLCWGQPPESLAFTTLAGLTSSRTFRLFPVNYWDAAKVTVKVNTMVLLLLAPAAIALVFTPACQLVLHNARQPFAVIPKCLVLLWGCGVFLSSLRLTPSGYDGLKYWKSWLETLAEFLVLLFLGVVFADPKLLAGSGFLLNCFLGAVFLLGVMGVFLFRGVRYRKAFGARTFLSAAAVENVQVGVRNRGANKTVS